MDSNANGRLASRKALALVVLVFVLGIALGGLSTYLVGGRVLGAKPQPTTQRDRRARMVEQFTRELSLTPDQQKQLEVILVEIQAKYKAIHDQMAPQTDQVRQQGREQIRSMLTAEQRPKLDELLRRLDEERKKRNER